MSKLTHKQVAGVRRVTSNVTLSGPDQLIADTTGGSFNIVLPDPADDGDRVRIYNGDGWGTNALGVQTSIVPPVITPVADAALQFIDFIRANGQWAQFRAGAGAGGRPVVSSTAPATPALGDLWFDNVSGIMFIWYDDGTDAAWMDVSGFSSGGLVRTVNGLSPDPLGNVAVSLTNVTTGVLSARPLTALEGDVYVVAGDPTTANNGLTFIWSGAGQWEQIGQPATASNDARYVLKAGDNAMTGNFVISAASDTLTLRGNRINLNEPFTGRSSEYNIQSVSFVDPGISMGTTQVQAGRIRLLNSTGTAATPTLPEHATTKQYVDTVATREFIIRNGATSVNIAHATRTALLFNTLDAASTGITGLTYNATNGRFTNTGTTALVFDVTAFVACGPGNTGSERAMWIAINGNDNARVLSQSSSPAPFNFNSMAGVFSLAAGEYFEVLVWQNSGTALLYEAPGGVSATIHRRVTIRKI